MSANKHNEKRPLNGEEKKAILTRRSFVHTLGLGGIGLGLHWSGFLPGRQLLPGAQQQLHLKPAHYYGHDAVTDQHGVIAPWYQQLNGQADLRVRIAAETLKRYPWTTREKAIAVYPDYLFTSNWSIDQEGNITPQHRGDWSNGDLGQRATSVLKGMVGYYRYSGDPAAIAHLTYMGNYLLDYCLTPEDHPWPLFPISVPVKGKPYGKADPAGMIQLDICGSMGEGLLQAYQVTKDQRWLDAAKHWGDLFAEHCNRDGKQPPWPRYVDPGHAPWKNDPRSNRQTGGVTMILAFLDELIRLGYTGKDQQITATRDAGLRYLQEVLLPKWTEDDTWAYYFWDWLNQTQNCSTTADVAYYIIRNKERFPNWQADARNILTLFLNRSSANPESGGDVYSGAWAYPESSSCCTRSLWYAPLMVGTVMAACGVSAGDALMRELAYRQIILQTYDIHENGVTEDNIEGGVIVNHNWLNIAHPWPLLWVQQAIGWLPEELGANRENHLVRSTAVVDGISYGKGAIVYSTFDAPPGTVDVLRLSFVPEKILTEGATLQLRSDLDGNGFVVEKLSNGDAIVRVRHDGWKKVTIHGADPQTELVSTDKSLRFKGAWALRKDAAARSGFIREAEQENASVTMTFTGNQVRITGQAGPSGGQADVYIDGVKQAAGIDCWNPVVRHRQILFYLNGLASKTHTLEIIVKGTANPYAKGRMMKIDTVQFSSETGSHHFPSGKGPTEPQRMIFGYTSRKDLTDSHGHSWRPATEVVTHLGARKDTVAACWMMEPGGHITGTPDAALYRYGYRAKDFWVNLTVGPGVYDVRLMFAAPEPGRASQQNGFDVIINGKTVVAGLLVKDRADKANGLLALLFRNIAPVNGIIQVRFKAVATGNSATAPEEAFVQALEIGQNLADV